MDSVPEKFAHGKQRSADDISRGCAKLFWQTRGAWGRYLTQLMWDRFSVNVEHTSDLTTDAESSYWEDYNGVTIAHIDEKFGPGTFQGALDEVAQYREGYSQSK